MPNRHATAPRVATAIPRTRAFRFMIDPPFATSRARQSWILSLPVAGGLDRPLYRRAVLEQGRLDGGIHLLVDPRVVERHLVLAHRAHDALDLARRMRGRLHQDEPLHPRIVVGRVTFVATTLAQLAGELSERAVELAEVRVGAAHEAHEDRRLGLDLPL